MKKVKKLGETMQKVKKKIGTSVQKYRYIEKKDFGDRLLSFMLDVSVALSPMMLWNIVMLAVLGSLMSFSGCLLYTSYYKEEIFLCPYIL